MHVDRPLLLLLLRANDAPDIARRIVDAARGVRAAQSTAVDAVYGKLLSSELSADEARELLLL